MSLSCRGDVTRERRVKDSAMSAVHSKGEAPGRPPLRASVRGLAKSEKSGIYIRLKLNSPINDLKPVTVVGLFN